METALLSVDNLNSMGQGKVTAFTLLNLSAAFDTIDHTIHLDRLRDWLGIEGSPCQLSQWRQTINIHGKLLVPMSLIYGVPQGSVLSPLLFILYTTLLSKINTNHNIIFMPMTHKFTPLSKQHPTFQPL